MAGKESGVQARIRNIHPKGAHCLSHRLNLVVNDLSTVPAIRNSNGTIKPVIVFVRTNAKRRFVFPLFC